MAVCLPCGTKHNPTRLPSKYGFIGWIGKCQLCNEVEKVYSNTHFGINPKVAAEPIKPAFLREKLSTQVQPDRNEENFKGS